MLYYFGTDLTQTVNGHAYWSIDGEKMNKLGALPDTPFSPEHLVNHLNKGATSFYQGGGFTALAISGSCRDSRPGAISVFWVKGCPISKQHLTQIILENPVANQIIEKMPFNVHFRHPGDNYFYSPGPNGGIIPQRMTASGLPQLSLGQLIQRVKACRLIDDAGESIRVIFDFDNAAPTTLHSWRFYPEELALGYVTHEENYKKEKPEGNAVDFLKELQSALDKSFEGYKGGECVMREDTPLWVTKDPSGIGQTAIVDLFGDESEIVIITSFCPVL